MNHKGFGTKKWSAHSPATPHPRLMPGQYRDWGCFSSDCLHPEAKDGGLSQSWRMSKSHATCPQRRTRACRPQSTGLSGLLSSSQAGAGSHLSH